MKSFVLGLMMALALISTARGADEGKGKTLAVIVAENEYKGAETMPVFAKMLEEKYGFKCELMIGSSDDKDPKRFNIPGIEKMKDADLAFVFARRRPLPKEQLQAVRDFLSAGKPLIGIRTASHAFAARKPDDPAVKGLEQWARFDKEVLGCNYADHYKTTPEGTAVTVIPEKKDHPILAGVDPKFTSAGTLYKINPLEPGAEALMMGEIAGQKPEPVLVTHMFGKSRVVYTTLGHPDDFKIPAFERMMVNAVFWALGMEAPKQ